MKKAFLVIVFVVGLAGQALADGIAPRVVIDPYDPLGLNRVVKLEVVAAGDQSWMYIPFATPVTPGTHPVVTVSFDVYRIRDAGGLNDQTAEWLAWLWDGDVVPYYGGQQQQPYGARTYPFVGAGYATGDAPTVFDRYTRLQLSWDFPNKWISSSYDGTWVDINQPLPYVGTALNGFYIALFHTSGMVEGDVAYFDNLVITGSDIYNANGFESFALGPLDGQGGWQGGTEVPVPEPGTITLVAIGLAGLVRARMGKGR